MFFVHKKLKTKNNRGKGMLFNAQKPNTFFSNRPTSVRLTSIHVYAVLLQSLVIALIFIALKRCSAGSIFTIVELYYHYDVKNMHQVDRPATSEITSTPLPMSS